MAPWARAVEELDWPRLALPHNINVSKRLIVVIRAGPQFLDSPGGGEAAGLYQAAVDQPSACIQAARKSGLTQVIVKVGAAEVVIPLHPIDDELDPPGCASSSSR